MDLGLSGKHVLITGGTRGIGLACARLYLEEGATVSICGRTQESCDRALRNLDAGDRVDAHVADVGDPAAAMRLVDAAEGQKGAVDVLVNSAGAAARRPFEELDAAAWHAAMQAKFHTYVNVMDVVIKRMGSRGGGSIVNIIGMGGKFPTTTHLAGGSANAALMLVTAGLAHAYAPRNVRVNAVNPTMTATERLQEGMAAQARQDGISIEEALRRSAAKMPLQRIATPEEVADVVVFLSSRRASYVSGAIVNLDGASLPAVV